MNAFKNIFSKVASKIPSAGQAAAGASAGGGGGGAAAGLVTTLATLGLGSYGLYHSMVTIQPGHRAVIYNRFSGLDDSLTLGEGLNFVIPWFQRAIVYDLRTRPQPIDTHSGSKGRFFSSCFFFVEVFVLYLVPVQTCKWFKSRFVCCLSPIQMNCPSCIADWGKVDFTHILCK